MLLSFEVSNYRSIKDTVVFDMSAINYYKEHRNELITSKLPGRVHDSFLRSAVIFGPNASGKSTVLRAMNAFQFLVKESAWVRPGAKLPYEPYLLDEESKVKPTTFAVEFVTREVRFSYSVTYNASMVIEEKLCAYPRGREQVWFERVADEAGRFHVRTSQHLRVNFDIETLLKENVLLLSLLANYPNFTDFEKIKRVYDWFERHLIVIEGNRVRKHFPVAGEIISGAQGSDFQRDFIKQMIMKADAGITDVTVKKIKQNPLEDLELSIENSDSRQGMDLLKSLKGLLSAQGLDRPQEMKAIVFNHGPQDKQVEIQISDESDGTFQLFSLSAFIGHALESGSTILVDELDASLHPIVVREIIRCFQDPEINTHNAQLICTAHNPSLLREDILRRDQVWFTEKVQGATELYPLSEFSPRNDESLMTSYLAGRYGAIPVVSDKFDLRYV